MSSKNGNNKDLLELQLGDLLKTGSGDLVAKIFQSGIQQLEEHKDGHLLMNRKERDDEFDTPVIEHYQRSEKALMIALAEAYVLGVSTCKMKKETEELLGKQFSSSTIDHFISEVDSELTPWRKRPIERPYPYLLLDAHSKKCRLNRRVDDITVLQAFGINDVGYRHVLAVETSWGDPGQVWSDFIGGLKQRGLSGVELFTSDRYPGIRAALREHYPGAYWQHCQYHFLQRARNRVPKNREEQIMEALEQIWYEENTLEEAQARLGELIRELEKPLPEVADWLKEQALDTLTVFRAAPEAHRRRLRTTYNIERLRRKLKKRSKSVRIFPNPESCLRLFGTLLKETHEDWLGSGWRYMKMGPRNEFRKNKKSFTDGFSGGKQ
jgi:putative transposase